MGMVVGYSPKNEDLVVNVCKKKHASNVRASGSDDALRLIPPKNMSLEEMLEFLGDDAVSYTHLDVYKRQPMNSSDRLFYFRRENSRNCW